MKGQFTHYELNGIPCFFGESLIRAHLTEKEIGAIGLFMQNEILKDSDIFPTRPFYRFTPEVVLALVGISRWPGVIRGSRLLCSHLGCGPGYCRPHGKGPKMAPRNGVAANWRRPWVSAKMPCIAPGRKPV